MPQIQDVEPARVIHELIFKSYGTYIVRRSISNDESVLQIRMNQNEQQNDSSLPYVILSIRVDEDLYKCAVTHYRLSLIGIDDQENSSQLFEQYNSLKNNSSLNRFTPLMREHIVKTQDQHWFIDPMHFNELNFSKGVGEHSAGTCLTTWQYPNQRDLKIFIKRFSKDDWRFKHELNLLKKVSYFSVMSLYGQYSNSKNNHLIFAYGGRSLRSLCPLRTRSVASKMYRITNIGFQIANGMIYLEKQNIIHRDLTADNVLLDRYGFVRIADFGHAVQYEEGKNNLERLPTTSGETEFQIRFLPPECLPEPKSGRTPTAADTASIYPIFSSKSDVWSFGILLIQLMIADPSKPYPDLQTNDPDVLQYVKIDRKIHESPSECSFDLYLLLRQCWAYDAKDRISFWKIRETMAKLQNNFL